MFFAERSIEIVNSDWRLSTALNPKLALNLKPCDLCLAVYALNIQVLAAPKLRSCVLEPPCASIRVYGLGLAWALSGEIRLAPQHKRLCSGSTVAPRTTTPTEKHAKIHTAQQRA